MDLKTLIAVLGILLPMLNATAQKIQPLNIGDTVPDFALPWYGNPQPEKLSDYKDKVVILDFWGTTCGPCVKEFPRLVTMQNELKDEIKIIPVAYESEAALRNFYLRWQKPYPPSIRLEDTARMYRWFPHQIIPHTVVLQKGLMVKDITASKYVDEQYLQKLLSHETVRLPYKKDWIGFRSDTSLIKLPEVVQGIQYGSMITGRLDGLPTSSGLFKNAAKQNGFNFINAPFLLLYCYAYHLPNYYFFTRVKLDAIQDSARYIKPKGMSANVEDNWKQAHTYTYSMMFPPGFNGNYRDNMVRDLDSFFFYKYHTVTKLETCMSECLALDFMPTMDIHSGAVAAHATKLISSRELTEWLELSIGIQPMVDDIQKDNIPAIQVSNEIFSEIRQKHAITEALKEALASNHLYLKPVRRPVEMLVIREETCPR